MGAAVVSGLFAVVLACLAWIFKNGSRRARLLSRIERYSQVLKDLPDGHPARVHLDAALAADSEQLLALTGWKSPEARSDPSPPQQPTINRGPGDTPSPIPTADEPSDPWYPPSPRPPVKPGPAYPPARRRDPEGAPTEVDPGAYEPVADEDPSEIDWMSDEGAGAPSTFPVPQAPPARATSTQPAGITPDPPPLPRRALLSGSGSTILWVLAGLSAVAAVGLAINDLLASPL